MKVAVYGAMGTTGTLVVEEVLRRGLSCLALGRDAVGLAALATRLPIESARCDVDEVAEVLHRVDVIIHCAGPFAATRQPIEDAALCSRVPVVHVCGEPSELAALFRRHDELSAGGITVVGAAGFSSAMAELACSLALQDMQRPARVEIVHAATASVPSVGSLRSYLADVATPLAGGDDVRVVDLPAPVGPRAVRRTLLAEQMTLPRSLGQTDVASFVAVGPPRSVVVKPPAFMRDARALEQMLAWRQAHGVRGPTADERAAMAFVLVATAHGSSKAEQRAVEFVGLDPYGLTALLAVQIAVDVVRAPKPGARAPLEVLAVEPALASIAAAGVRWRVGSQH